MSARCLLAAALAALLTQAAVKGADRPPTREEVEAGMGLPSQGDRVRGQKDTLGFVVDAAQAEEVIGLALDAERDALADRDRRLGLDETKGFLGGVCPHDDHLYASRVYVHLTQRITAPRVLLIGVFHRARYWDLENRLVFDSFESWHGPWGPVPVDPLREELLDALPSESVVVGNAMHAYEHSLEAIVPFLQHRNREVTIVPVLVPYVDWNALSGLAAELSDALAVSLRSHGWELGRDLAVVISSDAVHYGGDFDHAPFGETASGYLRAVERDRSLAQEHLTGPLRSSKLRGLLYELVDEKDVRRYLLPWCGRFSVPFGLEVLRGTAERLELSPPVGHLLRYGTSLSEPEPAVSPATREAGLGYTAPSNHHHWVGYAAVGFLPGE